MGRTKRRSRQYTNAAERAEVIARAEADVAAARPTWEPPPPAAWDVPRLYPSRANGGPAECVIPACHRLRERGDRSGYCRGHAAHYRRPDPPLIEVQKHLRALHAAGAQSREIADAAGVARRTVSRTLNARPEARVGMAVRWALVGVGGEVIGTVPRWRAVRRARSMIAAGASLAELAERAGWHEKTLTLYLAAPYAGRVSRASFEGLDEAWHEAEGRPVRPPADDVLPWMVRRQWPVPAAWDDIDEPEDDPDPGVTLGPGEYLAGLAVIRRVTDHHGLYLGAHFTGRSGTWTTDLLRPVRRNGVRSTALDVAVSAATPEHDRLSTRAADQRRRAVNGDGVRDGAALEAASA